MRDIRQETFRPDSARRGAVRGRLPLTTMGSSRRSQRSRFPAIARRAGSGDALSAGHNVVGRRGGADRSHQHRDRRPAGPVCDPARAGGVHRFHGPLGLVHLWLAGHRHGVHQDRPHPANGLQDVVPGRRTHEYDLSGVLPHDRRADVGHGPHRGRRYRLSPVHGGPLALLG